ncbi:MAG: hypothetical protein HY301_01770 [Verrucomicrobia bacterium]|nr:hypothetical protein [Verrucomicrobiota bacterium]
MKKLLLALTIAVCAFAITAGAAEKKKKEMSPEQKALVEKYDANKDGKLDADEIGKMTPEDKEAWGKFTAKKKKKAA